VLSAAINDPSGAVLSVKLTADILTGATPNGAAPARFDQSFEMTTTGASAGVVTAEPHVLPVDNRFKDTRYAIDAGYSFLATPDLRLSLGGAYPHETDYESYSGNLGLARDLNGKNTTLAVAMNYEFDRSRPINGTPNPLTPIDGPFLNGGGTTKKVVSLVVGVTQVINRHWLVQANYSLGHATGYQIDPYRIITMVDAVSGDPVQYLYEGRPNSRVRQSVYIGNKVALGSNVLDLSARAYRDSWGITSATVEAAVRTPVTSHLYLEPRVRYYQQTAADFFRYYLVRGQPLPAAASSDVRLGKFEALTLGLKLGLKLGRANELYLLGETYRQTGDKHPAGTFGALARENLFSGVRANSIIVGYSFAY
jgi:hypothetical protein